MKKNKLVMVDMDDTLVYTLKANYVAYREALAEYGFSLTIEEYSEICNGRPYNVFLPKIMGDKNPSIERVHQRKIELYSEYMHQAELNKPLADILHALKPTYYLALVTTASRVNVERILETFSLTELFDLIVSGEDVKNGKPAPDCYLLAMEHFGLGAEQSIIFEDSPSGIKAAEASHCRTFCVKWEK